MPTWKLTIEYEGTRYYGWQEQRTARTVGGELRKAAEDALEGRVDLGGAGRTDAGVHALAQVARLGAAKRIQPRALLHALNDRLPADINVLKVDAAPREFDPRRSPTARYYLYQISTRRTAFAKKLVWWVKDPLDVERMRTASQSLLGRHDFAAFCDKRVEDASTTVNVQNVEITAEGDLVLFRIGASHFLWKMVRRLVGTLVEVGRGHLDIENVARLLSAGKGPAQPVKFEIAEHTAPPSGLFLEHVSYGVNDRPGPLSAAFGVRRNG
ncbi:MAG TPA: tRNA pseudouridine(38-40) synthase TruA [Blastocatellia bacterium]|nr:tRNA pseudouridine(38-40) synthase TruA [Blastocatellia bacterium]